MRNILVKTLALSALTMGSAIAVDNDPFAGFGSQDRIGQGDNELRWGMYGELHYNNPQSKTDNDQLDLHRLVFMAEYTFDDKISFFSEIEIEHAFVNDGQGELEVEQAYLDFAMNDSTHVRAGVLLVPISIMNLYHEPTLFFGVERPDTQKYIVPTTWFEPGVSVVGDVNDQLSYEVALQAGLSNAGFSTSGIRGGRQKAYESAAEDIMITARLDYRPTPELWLAGALNHGATAQDPSGQADSGNLTLLVLEGRYDSGPYKAGITLSQGMLDDAETMPQPDVSEEHTGIEVFAGVDIMPFISDSRSDSLSFFVRYETYDTQADVPSGNEDESKMVDVITYGFDYKPHPNVVVKIDYQDYDNDADNAVDKWNMGIGWMF